ncbi:hypothetical protein BIS06_14080, partial [Halomonas sp. BBD48]|nr:hypothetical protein [Halomonas sp. BBD48]
MDADVAAAVVQGGFESAYEYCLAFDWEEDIEACQVSHPVVAAAGLDPLGHFLMWGSMEGRVVSA